MCSSTAAFWPRTVSRPGLSFFRERDERYADIIRVGADAFGEDDCESIGGCAGRLAPGNRMCRAGARMCGVAVR